MKYRSPSKGLVTISDIGNEIANFIRDDTDSKYRLVVGSDSRGRSEPVIDMVTAIVIHRKGSGARYFYKKFEIENIYNLKQKLYEETMSSLDTARNLLGVLKDDLNGHYEDLEIHIDVGKNGDSREVIKELTGMVIGNGFKAQTKPSSFAATCVADKYT